MLVGYFGTFKYHNNMDYIAEFKYPHIVNRLFIPDDIINRTTRNFLVECIVNFVKREGITLDRKELNKVLDRVIMLKISEIFKCPHKMEIKFEHDDESLIILIINNDDSTNLALTFRAKSK